MPASSAKNKTINYQVRRGDSLSSIAEKFQISVTSYCVGIDWKIVINSNQDKP